MVVVPVRSTRKQRNWHDRRFPFLINFCHPFVCISGKIVTHRQCFGSKIKNFPSRHASRARSKIALVLTHVPHARDDVLVVLWINGNIFSFYITISCLFLYFYYKTIPYSFFFVLLLMDWVMNHGYINQICMLFLIFVHRYFYLNLPVNSRSFPTREPGCQSTWF